MKLITLLLLLCTLPLLSQDWWPAAGLSQQQISAGGGGGGGSKALVFNGITTSSTITKTTTGSSFILLVENGHNGTPGAPSDSLGNTPTQVAMATNDAVTFGLAAWAFYAPTTGSDTFTAGANTSVMEVSGWSGTQSGSAAFDGSSTNGVPPASINGASAQCGLVTPSTSSDLFLAIAANEIGTSSTIAFTNTYTLLDTNYPSPCLGVAYQLSTSNSAANPVVVFGQSDWIVTAHIAVK
ncbi:MAG: hypothetical protein KGL39_02975 [Patescibacteria group bacterium]|nr:hypothetical protein [Patescibacteria group bacterium]